MELLQLSPKDSWTLDEACLGTLITGGIGSGKTTGAFQYVTRSFLRAGFGGLFLCAKIQSFDDCMDVVRLEGREKDVVVFDLPKPGEEHPPFCFNFLTYEAQRYGDGQVILENIVNLLDKASEGTNPSPSDDKFFESAKTQLLWHCLEIIIAATGKVNFDDLLDMIESLPQSTTQAESGLGGDGEKLRSTELLEEAERKAGKTRAHELHRARQYVMKAWPVLAPNTRSSIFITLSVFLHKLVSFPLKNLFTGELTISPDYILNGGIVIVKLNISEHDPVSKFAGIIWKYALQKAIERRPELHDKSRKEHVRPIFIAIDEAQFWVTKDDYRWQTTARDNRGLTVFATQSITNFHAEMANNGPAKARVESLLGCLPNRFFCQNLQQETNLWGSESIGKVTVRRSNAGDSRGESVTSAKGGGSRSASVNYNQGWSESLDYDVQPRVFTTLQRGGVRNKKLKPIDTTQREDDEEEEVAPSGNGSFLDKYLDKYFAKYRKKTKRGQAEALVVIAGKVFEANGERWLRVLFEQFSDMPPWLALNTEKPWASIISGKTKKTRWESFRETVPLTRQGIWEALLLWYETRKVDRE